MLLPEPTYKGPESIVYFRGNTMAEELQRDTKVGLGISLRALHSGVYICQIFLIGNAIRQRRPISKLMTGLKLKSKKITCCFERYVIINLILDRHR